MNEKVERNLSVPIWICYHVGDGPIICLCSHPRALQQNIKSKRHWQTPNLTVIKIDFASPTSWLFSIFPTIFCHFICMILFSSKPRLMDFYHVLVLLDSHRWYFLTKKNHRQYIIEMKHLFLGKLYENKSFFEENTHYENTNVEISYSFCFFYKQVK